MTETHPAPVPAGFPAPPLSGRPMLRQEWSTTVFLHWRVDAGVAQSLMPPDVRVDTLGGVTYASLVLTGFEWTAPLAMARVPYLGRFPQVNLRLYTADRFDRHGVFFVGMLAGRLATVAGARAIGDLPYRWMRMAVRRTPQGRTWRVRRGASDQVQVSLDTDHGTQAHPTEEEEWLTGRWGMHSQFRGRTLWTRVTHRPWILCPGEAQIDAPLLADLGVVDPRVPDLRPLWAPPVVADVGWPTALAANGTASTWPPGERS